MVRPLCPSICLPLSEGSDKALETIEHSQSTASFSTLLCFLLLSLQCHTVFAPNHPDRVAEKTSALWHGVALVGRDAALDKWMNIIGRSGSCAL